MQYVKFWIRSVLLLVPATFLILYFGSHVPLQKVLIAVAVEALFGIVTVFPLILFFSKVDRSLWSEDEYDVRIAKRKAQIHEQRRRREEAENGPEK